MLRGRQSAFSSTNSAGSPGANGLRGFNSAASASSSVTTTLPRPLTPEDVYIEIVMDGTVTALNNLAPAIANAPTQHIVERSFFTTPLNARGKPVRRPVRPLRIEMKSIQVSVTSSPEEGLFFGKSMLKADEVEVVTTWLFKNYSLAALQRASIQVVHELHNAEENDDRLVEALEQRALVVAEATSRRAEDEAKADDSGGNGTLQRVRPRGLARPQVNKEEKRRKKEKLLVEKESVEETLTVFNTKIAMFAVEDPATAEMLMPAKLDLESKLRHILAQLASCGVGSNEARRHAAQVSAPADGYHVTEDVSVRQEFVPEPLEHLDQESSSSDESDCAMAVPIDGSECDGPIISCSSERGGYVSSCDSVEAGEENKLRKFATRSAEFVIDLSRSTKRIGPRSQDVGNELDLGEISLGLDQCLVDDGLNETLNIPLSPVGKTDFADRSLKFGGYSSDLESCTLRSSRNARNWYGSEKDRG